MIRVQCTEKVINKSVSIMDCAKINATSTTAEAEEFHQLINQKSGFKLINTGTIDRYECKWGKDELTDKGEKYMRPYLTTNPKIIGANRMALYTSAKIILAKIAITTEAFFDKKGEYASINTNCFHDFNKEYVPEYILSWVNSKLFQFMFECFFDGLKMQGGYLLYSSPNISKMFIKKIPKKEQTPFISIVNKIISLKEQNKDTGELEAKIDAMVYELYGLTKEEIKIVEGK